jgi:hypothetical protein
MNKLTVFLLKLNNRVYNFCFHIPAMLLWMAAIACSHSKVIRIWEIAGGTLYLSLIIVSILKRGFPPLPKTRKEFLGYLVGLNIAMVLGPLAFGVIYLLHNYDPDEE